ncbi:MAG: hypothetical protein IKW74_02620, partial [Thermoguttaceae bacterium]|nr:hypothetical protein [Thermoguttaceae bacterium]
YPFIISDPIRAVKKFQGSAGLTPTEIKRNVFSRPGVKTATTATGYTTVTTIENSGNETEISSPLTKHFQ